MVSVAILCSILMAAPAEPKELPTDPAALAELIEKLVADLASDDYEKREGAGETLRRIGMPALKALEKASGSDNSKLRYGVRKILKDVKLGITPDWPADLTLLARYYDRMHKLDRRRKALRRVADALKEKAVALLIAAMAAPKADEAECALVALKRINTEVVCRALVDQLKKPQNAHQTRALALAHARLGLEFDARHILDAGPVDPSTRDKMTETGMRQLLEQLEKGEYDDVAEYAGRFAKAVAAEPRFLYIQAEALAALGKVEPAEALRKQALALNPDKEILHDTAAEMLMNLGRRRLAALEWGVVLKAPPADGLYDINACLRLAEIYKDSGLFDKAADSLAMGLEAYRKARAAGRGTGYAQKRIRVARWGLINGQAAAMTRAERGDSAYLVVEAFTDHPELDAEVTWDTLDHDFDLSLYVDPSLGPTGPPRLSGIRVTPSEVWLPLDDKQQFTAVLIDQYGNPIDGKIDWSVSIGGMIDPGMFYGGARYFDAFTQAGDGTIDETGLFTGNKSGMATVFAAAAEDPAVRGRARLGIGHVPAIIPSKHAPLRIGGSGDMDRARIYSRALTPEEIADHAAGKGLDIKDASLLGNWDFEKIVYGAYRNTVGLGLSAKVVGEVEQLEENGRKYLRFGGKGHLEVPQDRSLNISKACTVEVWIRPGNGGYGGQIIGKFSTDWWGFLLEMEGGGLRLRCMGDLVARYTVPRDVWTYVAAVMGGNGMLQIYVNGKLLKEQKPHAFIVYY